MVLWGLITVCSLANETMAAHTNEHVGLFPRMPTEALSCRKEAIFEHGAKTPLWSLDQEPFRWMGIKWDTPL